ncbi:MAG: alkaline phosphatase D family protein [Flavobacteriales bacterium]|nr:alkaline phosphatase D family protein [Flavobacteriales bacterium]
MIAQRVTHGPVVGAATPNGARVYVRTSQATAFDLQLSLDDQFTSPLTFNGVTVAERDTSIIIDVNGLEPFTEYYYRVMINGQADSLQGHFRTFPAHGERGDYVWTVLSCQELGTYNAFNALVEQAPDLVIHTGDWTYPDYQMPFDWRMNWQTLQRSYRRRYSEEEPNMPRLIRSTVFDYVVDNHDGIWARTNNHFPHFVVNDDSTASNSIDVWPTPEGAFENMMAAYKEYFPHYPLADEEVGMYHSYRYGNAEVFFVDVRNCGNHLDSTFRYEASEDRWYFDPRPGQTLLGAQQLQWLKDGLAQSTADWKFIVSGVMFNKQFRKVINVGMGLQSFIFDLGDETGTGFKLAHSLCSNWAGYPMEQEGVLDFIADNSIKDVIVLSGHVHTNVMDDGRNAGLPELNTGPVAGFGPELTYHIDSVMQLLGMGTVKDSLWNGGGQGVNNMNFKSGFGKIEIFRNDSVRLCIIDEDNVIVDCMTLPHSSQPSFVPLHAERAVCVLEDVYPNPTDGTLNLRFCADYSPTPSDRYCILDVAGRSFHPFEGYVGGEIDTRHLSAGNYLLIYDYGDDVQTVRFVVSN